MSTLNSFKQALFQAATTDSNAQYLEELTTIWVSIDKSDINALSSLKGFDLFSMLSSILELKYLQWKSNYPLWVTELVRCMIPYREEVDLFPFKQTQELLRICRNYIFSGCWACMQTLSHIASFAFAKQILLEDNELYETLKKELHQDTVLYYFGSCTGAGCDPWQLKLLEDKEFITALLSQTEVNKGWNVFVRLAQHPDAKTLLPKEALIRASKSQQLVCKEFCTLVCNDEDLELLHLDTAYFDKIKQRIESLLATGRAEQGGASFSLLPSVLEIANLSGIEKWKGELGKNTIVPLLQIVAGTLPDFALVRKNLLRNKQTASRALWNLAYLPANCTLIKAANGIAQLKQELKQCSDPVLNKNILGILYMLEHHTEALPTSGKNKHIMISYNWGNQGTVIKLAQYLTTRGYSVWLDVEQMNGSTLEAMASAIEGSELVLMCMSQKYKDSPNCRLEGEYTMNRRIHVIPLMMQKGYSPDGWLGITLGSKLWYDFCDDSDWEQKMAGLIKAIDTHRAAKGISSVSTPPPATSGAKKPIEWTLEDIKEWMQATHIGHHYELFVQHKLDGCALMELQKHLDKSLFRKMCETMGIVEFGEVLRLAAAIRKL